MEAYLLNPIKSKDGKEMAYIPGGTYTMGSEGGYKEEKPVHDVTVKSFYMDRYLVTNKEFKDFCDQTGTRYPENPRWQELPDYFLRFPDYPAINVSWQAAREYAKWAGKRLPTEEEWEYAAAGGLENPLYAWGNDHPENSSANYADRNTEYAWRDFRYSSGYRYTSPVGVYKPNGFGLFDMTGNVWEWCEDWFFLYADTIRDTAGFDDGWGGSRVCRGGCYHSNLFDLRISRRRQVLGGQGLISVGFRCVQDVEGSSEGDQQGENKAEIKEWTNKLKSINMKLDDDTELCLGVGMLSKESAGNIKNVGFTSVEQYVTWQTIENEGRDNWDFSTWDDQVSMMKDVGLKWVPFLIAGPAYSLPDWYRESRDFEGLCCLEHNVETKIQSIWDKNFHVYIDRYLEKFAEHYGKSDILEAVLLGITGDFGEAIFPVWHGNWPTQIPGIYHSHAGYWCNDRYARKDFREKMKEKYGSIDPLNSRWGTGYHSFEEVEFPQLQVDPIEGFRVDEFTRAGTYAVSTVWMRNRWVDFIDWYRKSMTDYADYWMQTARKHFPNIPVYLCTGGDAVPVHGSDFAWQCKIAAKSRGGVRITNEASKYANNFVQTNWVASAGRHYGAYFGFEPAGMVNEKGVVCRIYNAAATGAKELHYYEGNLFDQEKKMDLFLKNLQHLQHHEVIREIGVLYPDISAVIGNISSSEMFKNFELLRDFTDYQYVDDQTIEDGILQSVRCVMIPCGEIYRQKTLEALWKWVEKGGLLITWNTQDIRCLETDESWGERFFDFDNGTKTVGQGATLFLAVRVTPQDQTLHGVPGTKPLQGTMAQEEGFYQVQLFSPMESFLISHGLLIPDGKLDGIYITCIPDGLLVLNTGDGPVNRTVRRQDGSEMGISIPGNSIIRQSLI